jgi:hypothetical protein
MAPSPLGRSVLPITLHRGADLEHLDPDERDEHKQEAENREERGLSPSPPGGHARVQQAGVDGQVEVVLGDAHENVKRLKDPIDVLFLDADKEGYGSYLKTLLPLVRPGGLIMADNVAMAEDYIQAVTTDPQLDTVFFGRFAVTLKKR